MCHCMIIYHTVYPWSLYYKNNYVHVWWRAENKLSSLASISHVMCYVMKEDSKHIMLIIHLHTYTISSYSNNSMTLVFQHSTNTRFVKIDISYHSWLWKSDGPREWHGECIRYSWRGHCWVLMHWGLWTEWKPHKNVWTQWNVVWRGTNLHQ